MRRTPAPRHCWRSCGSAPGGATAFARRARNARRRAEPGHPSRVRRVQSAVSARSARRDAANNQGWRRRYAPCSPVAWPPAGYRPIARRVAPDRPCRGSGPACRRSCRSSAAAHRARGRASGNRQSPVPGAGDQRLPAHRYESGLPARCSGTPPRPGPGAIRRRSAVRARQRPIPPAWRVPHACCAGTADCRPRFPGCRYAVPRPKGLADDGARRRKNCRFPARRGTRPVGRSVDWGSWQVCACANLAQPLCVAMRFRARSNCVGSKA
ncbi:hypothetical protein D3C78_928010 [compost metagenome]